MKSTRSLADPNGRDWLKTTLSVLTVIGVGVLLGTQYIAPDKRMLQVLMAVLLFGVAWRIDIITGVGVMLIALPFPRGTAFGNTNLAFVLLMAILWVLRASLRNAPAPRGTPLDAPLVSLMIAYVISFYNVDTADHLDKALKITYLVFACFVMFYVIVGTIRTERDLRRLHAFMIASTALIYLFCFWELAFPGRTLIPGWLDYSYMDISHINTKNYRVGGPWIDYELMGEFTATSILFFMFLIAQARSAARRFVFTLFLLASLLILFTTVTRGAFIALAVGLAYLGFLTRRHLQIVPFTILGGIATVVVLGMNFYVSTYTTSGNIFSRLGDTHFKGLVPDSRVDTWPQAVERWMIHPIIGHGPLYTAERGLKVWFWPHDLYLFYANCVGIVGLSVFLWLMWKLVKLTIPPTDRLDDKSYVKSYLLVAHVQLVVFLVDQIKIEYLRNPTYQFEVWVLFASITAAALVYRDQRAAAAAAPVAGLAQPLVPARA